MVCIRPATVDDLMQVGAAIGYDMSFHCFGAPLGRSRCAGDANTTCFSSYFADAAMQPVLVRSMLQGIAAAPVCYSQAAPCQVILLQS
jgi:hypothetical protein